MIGGAQIPGVWIRFTSSLQCRAQPGQTEVFWVTLPFARIWGSSQRPRFLPGGSGECVEVVLEMQVAV